MTIQELLERIILYETGLKIDKDLFYEDLIDDLTANSQGLNHIIKKNI